MRDIPSPGSAVQTKNLRGLARGGAVNLAGSASQALLAFALLLVLTRGLGAGGSGALLEAIALFNILAATATLGVDTGFIFSISRMRAAQQMQDLPTVYRVGYTPILVVGVIASGAILLGADPLANLLGDSSHATEIAAYLRTMAWFIPLASLQLATLGATRAYETMTPTVLIDGFAKLALQVAFVFTVISLGSSHQTVAFSWATPILITLVWATWWRRRLDTAVDVQTTAPITPIRQVTRDFWAYTLPRSFASVFRTAIQWLDVLLVGALLSPAAAAVYGVSTRLLQFGVAVAFAIGQVSQPMVGRLFSSGQHSETKAVFSVATTWQILLSWPQYITIAIFAAPLLTVFGPEFVTGAQVAAVLAVSTMIGSAAGPVDMVLLMAGKSMWSFWNTALSLSLNVALNFLLIPRMGILGAAVAWSVARIVGNVVPSIQVAAHLKLHPFSRSWLQAALVSLSTFGITGIVLRSTLGATLGALLACLAITAGIYAGALYALRDSFELRSAIGTFSRRFRSEGAAPPKTYPEPSSNSTSVP